ncbi:hypothetical protein Esti_004078 [Eimeria stiedai]
MSSSHARTKLLRTHGRRLFSDVEASAVPGLHCSMAAEIPELEPCVVRSERPGSLQSLAAPPLTSRGSCLTGNVLVDYRRYSARRLLDLKELQRCREASALQSLAPASLRSLLSCHSASVTRLSLDHTGQCRENLSSAGSECRRYLLSSSRDCSIALYDLDADSAWNLNGGFGPTPKVPPIGFVQRRPERPPRRILHPVRFQSAAARPLLRAGGTRKNVVHRCAAGGSFSAATSDRPQRGHWHSVTSVEFMPEDSGLFVSAGLDKVFKVWDTQVWEPVLDIGVHSPILCCAFNRTTCHQSENLISARGNSFDLVNCRPAQLLVAGGSQDGTIRIFDLRCGVAQQTLAGHKDAVLAATWSSWSPYQLFSGSSDKSIRGWDLRRSDSCFVFFDKNKPDTAFIGERCCQSAAFRQLARSKTFMGQRHYRNPVPDVSAAAACAAFKGEPFPCPASSNSVTTSCSASFDERGSGGNVLQIQGDQTTACTRTSDAGIAAISRQTQYGGVQADSLAYSKAQQPQGSKNEGKTGVEAHRGSRKPDAHANDEQPQVHSRLRNGPAGARPRVNSISSCSKGTDGRTTYKRRLSSTVVGLRGKRSQTDVSSLAGRCPTEACMLSRPEGSGKGLLGNCRTQELLLQYARILGEQQAKARQKNKRTSTLGASRNSVEHDASLRYTMQRLERVQDHHLNEPVFQRMKRGVPTFEASGDILSEPLRKQVQAESLPELRFERPDEESDGLMRKGSSWSSYGASSPSCWSAHRNISSGEVAHDGPVTCLIQSPDGRFLISSGGDGRIRLWNAANGCHCFIHMNLNMSPSCHNSQARSVQRSESRNAQPSARSGDVNEAANANPIDGIALWGKQAAMSSSGDYLVHGRGRVLCTYDIFTGTELQIVAPGHSQDVVCVTWNGRKDEVYSGASDGRLLVCDATWYSASQDDDELSDDEDVGVVDIATHDYM